MIEKLRKLTGISDLIYQRKIQSLWSGYGEIARYYSTSQHRNIVVKQVTPPDNLNHPRGWNSDLSHKRKLHSYEVESYFYQHYANDCNLNCRVPNSLLTHREENQFFMVLEDIDGAGFPLRYKQIKEGQISQCLTWLANFHGQYLQHCAEGLWSTGTYWHLATRPDELEKMPDSTLKKCAHDIDQRLNSAKFLTIVHGDAKLANFCFARDKQAVAAVDFQYVGKGVGVKDVMLFLGSCLEEQQLFEFHDSLIDHYFKQLRTSLLSYLDKEAINRLEREWRELLPFAWADFHRFLTGWSPDHFKINRFMQLHTEKVLAQVS